MSDIVLKLFSHSEIQKKTICRLIHHVSNAQHSIIMDRTFQKYFCLLVYFHPILNKIIETWQKTFLTYVCSDSILGACR